MNYDKLIQRVQKEVPNTSDVYVKDDFLYVKCEGYDWFPYKVFSLENEKGYNGYRDRLSRSKREDLYRPSKTLHEESPFKEILQIIKEVIEEKDTKHELITLIEALPFVEYAEFLPNGRILVNVPDAGNSYKVYDLEGNGEGVYSYEEAKRDAIELSGFCATMPYHREIIPIILSWVKQQKQDPTDSIYEFLGEADLLFDLTKGDLIDWAELPKMERVAYKAVMDSDPKLFRKLDVQETALVRYLDHIPVLDELDNAEFREIRKTIVNIFKG